MLLLTDTIQVVNSTIKDNPNEKLAEVISNLERLHIYTESSLPKEMIKHLKKIAELYQKINNSANSLDSINMAESILKELEDYIQKYQNYLQNNDLQIFNDVKLRTQVALKMAKSTYLLNKAKDEEQTAQARDLFYLGWIHFSQFLSNHIHELPKNLVEATKEASQKIISSEEVKDSKNHLVVGIYNTAKAILWDIDKYEKTKREDFSTAKSILNLLDTSPKWDWGDDFEECLDYVNEVRD